MVVKIGSIPNEYRPFFLDIAFCFLSIRIFFWRYNKIRFTFAPIRPNNSKVDLIRIVCFSFLFLVRSNITEYILFCSKQSLILYNWPFTYWILSWWIYWHKKKRYKMPLWLIDKILFRSSFFIFCSYLALCCLDEMRRAIVSLSNQWPLCEFGIDSEGEINTIRISPKFLIQMNKTKKKP